MSNFSAKRRQQFLSESFYQALLAHRLQLLDDLQHELAQPEIDDEGRSLLWASVADEHYELLSLRYTAGESIDRLRDDLGKVIMAHAQYQKALAAYEAMPQIAPLGLERPADFERCMQLIGLCYLLHRRDLLPVIAQLEDPGYAGHDALYEELLDYELPGRFNTDKLYHGTPYSLLVQAMFRDTDEQSVDDLKSYCQAWYPAMRDTPWHDGHLGMTDTDGYYFGYWAFEAGAVAYLLGLDDPSIDHLVYPKDLVKFAREFQDTAEKGASASDRLRVDAGDPCPRDGYWFTPAMSGSRRYFRHGEVMPDTKSQWGATIWQWDIRQD